MRKGEATRQRIIETASELMHVRGINVVSVGDVLAASETGKSQFYSHFSSREDLVNTVLKCNKERICESISQPIASWYDAKNWLFMHLNSQRMYSFERGCPFGTAAYALTPDQNAERIPLRRILDRTRERLSMFLCAEQEAGRLKPSASPDKLANFAVASVQGGMMIGLLEENEKGVRAALEECYAHLVSFRV